MKKAQGLLLAAGLRDSNLMCLINITNRIEVKQARSIFVMAINKNRAKQKTKPVILVVDDQPQDIELLRSISCSAGL